MALCQRLGAGRETLEHGIEAHQRHSSRRSWTTAPQNALITQVFSSFNIDVSVDQHTTCTTKRTAECKASQRPQANLRRHLQHLQLDEATGYVLNFLRDFFRTADRQLSFPTFHIVSMLCNCPLANLGIVATPFLQPRLLRRNRNGQDFELKIVCYGLTFESEMFIGSRLVWAPICPLDQRRSKLARTGAP